MTSSIAPRQAPSPAAILPVVHEGLSPASSVSRRLASSNRTVVPAIKADSPASAPSPIEAFSPGSSVTQIITSKEWVLPPRPKPGRKPSVDTPASKRKAQNRAAQRAFRERRATRVQELEEKLMEVEKENEFREMGLASTINSLKLENQLMAKKLDQLRKEMNLFKESHGAGSSEYSSQPQFKQSFTMSTNSTPHSTGSAASSTYSVQQISPAPSADSPPSSKHSSLHDGNKSDSVSSTRSINFTPLSQANSPVKEDNFDCGVCVKDDCLCESVGLKSTPGRTDMEIDILKLEETVNSFKPMSAVMLPRKRKNTQSELYTDFTAQFSTKQKQMPDLKKLKKSKPEAAEGQFNESSPVDNCGFCSDDTPCVCREAAKEAALLNMSLNEVHPHNHQHDDHHDHVEDDFNDDKTLPPILNSKYNTVRQSTLPVLHPGPSVEIRDIANLTPGAVPVVTVSARNSDTRSSFVDLVAEANAASDSGCTGNPGTCNQCQLDPMSTLFCTTVASKTAVSSLITNSTYGSASPQRMVSRSESKEMDSISSLPVTPSSSAPPALIATNNPATSTLGMFIPCADAYKTLSRHKKFNSADFSTMLGKLTTRGMQVEVQSIANVLRELDRRIHD